MIETARQNRRAWTHNEVPIDAAGVAGVAGVTGVAGVSLRAMEKEGSLGCCNAHLTGRGPHSPPLSPSPTRRLIARRNVLQRGPCKAIRSNGIS